MADPLSVAGAVVGVASLGIQIYSGITEYLNAIQCRTQDLNTVRQKVAIFALSITAIEEAERRLLENTTSSHAALPDCIKACRKELQALQHFLTTFDSGNVLKSKSTQKILNNKTTTLSYPFKRKTLWRLEERLHRANEMLCTNLQATGIEAATHALEAISSLRDITLEASAKINNIMSRTDALLIGTRNTHTKIETINNAVLALQARFFGIEKALAKTAASPDETFDQMAMSLQNMSLKQGEYVSTPDEHPLMRQLGVSSSLQNPPVSSLTSLKQATHSTFPITQHHGCSCLRNGAYKEYSMSFLPLEFSLRHEKTGYHNPSCLFSKMQGVTRRFDARVAILHRIFSCHVSVIMSLKIGPKEFGLTPCIDCVQVVSDYAPAFQVIELMKNSQQSLNHRASLEILQYGISSLENLIRTGKASLLDVDSRGQGIIDRLLYIFWLRVLRFRGFCNINEMLKITLGFLETLLAWGITARNRNDISNEIWWALGAFHASEKLEAGKCSSNGVNLVTKLRSLGWDPFIPTSHFSDYGIYMIQYSNKLFDLDKGALLQAIHDRNERSLRDAIAKHPDFLKEQLSLGNSYLTMAITWPRGLNVLVDALSQHELTADEGLVVAEAFSKAFHYFCVRPPCAEEYDKNQTCFHTECAQVLQPLLRLGFPCRHIHLLQDAFRFWRCRHGKRAMISTLRAQRNRLKALAVQYLPHGNLKRYGILNESVPDSCAGMVVKSLEDLGVHIPEAIWVPREWQSVYIDIVDPCGESLSDLWEAGFRDINFESMLPNTSLYNHFILHSAHRISWHLSHGVDINMMLENNSVAHIAAAFLADEITYPRVTRKVKKLIKEALHWDSRDSCRCHCSPLGCTPFVVLADRVLRSIKNGVFVFPDRKGTISLFLKLFDHTIEERKAVVRLLTFTELDMAHTCCHRDYLERRHLLLPLDDEEVGEIQEEDRCLKGKLDELMIHFGAELEQQYFSTSLQDFIGGYWTRKMEKFKIETSRANLGEAVQEAFKIGVTLHPEPEPTSNREHERDLSTSDYWMKMIDAADASVSHIS